ncbi:hypothetical protein AZSI13_29200 [Azospira sp. I13]|uniref:nuclease-related domain-containing protein n=1 Tax=Azospira sp. I13 TaxID=1765050 RepID=UPI000D4B041A|nr:nuclease-related domain-containing protein [Azospira sp. I13]GBG03593.1 hypothetical protein AZSI13_29200 [Azospira sp. I13]
MNWGPILNFIGVIPMLVVVGMVLLKQKQLARDLRCDPLTTDLLRLPGDSLQERSEAIMDKHLDRLILVAISGLMLALLIAIRRIGDNPTPWQWLDTALLLLGLVAGLVIGWKITQVMPERRRLRQGLRAEQATAQEMAAALAGDNRLIHDVQAGEFNIDHVVITPGGVFAVETKSRLKPPSGNDRAKVKYDGKTLDFGTWRETKPLEQAARQAQWLASYLKKATGRPYAVTPVLALPGWYVENVASIGGDMVRVINPKNTRYIVLPPNPKNPLDAEAIQQADYMIQQLAKAKTD